MTYFLAYVAKVKQKTLNAIYSKKAMVKLAGKY